MLYHKVYYTILEGLAFGTFLWRSYDKHIIYINMYYNKKNTLTATLKQKKVYYFVALKKNCLNFLTLKIKKVF